MRAVKPAHERVLARSVNVGSCLIWQGSRTKNGYGRVGVGSRTDGTRRLRSVHVVLWETINGPVPAGLELDHLCRNRACVNVEHLEPKTHAENCARADHSQRVAGLRAITHCPQGHPYDESNTRWSKEGRRACRPCAAACERRRRDRMREAA